MSDAAWNAIGGAIQFVAVYGCAAWALWLLIRAWDRDPDRDREAGGVREEAREEALEEDE